MIGDTKKVAELLERGADPNIRDNEGWTPLHNACSVGWLPEHKWFGPEHSEIVSALLAAGADINAQSAAKQFTPLHVAYMSRQSELVKLLVAAGANSELRDTNGDSPGYWYDRPEIAAILAAHGVTPTAPEHTN